jgi:hypothetical protein
MFSDEKRIHRELIRTELLKTYYKRLWLVLWFLQRSVSEHVASTGSMNCDWQIEWDFEERVHALI